MSDEQDNNPGSENGRSREPEFAPSRVDSNAAQSNETATDTQSTGDQSTAKPVQSQTRPLATEVPVKTAAGAVAELSEYVVSIDSRAGAVKKIERLVGTERQPLSPSNYASVVAQLGTAARTASTTKGAQGGSAIPQMLDAPAFNNLVARSVATSPAIAQLARDAAAPMAAAAPRMQPNPGQGKATDPTAILQAYYQGALDYLKALATAR